MTSDRRLATIATMLSHINRGTTVDEVLSVVFQDFRDLVPYDRIAGCEVPSVRVLQGAVHGAVALQRNNLLDLRRLDAELTRISVGDCSPGALEDRALLDIIARYFEVTFDELAGRSRKLPIGNARAIAVAALKERGRSLSEIALILGNRDRSTISQLAERGRTLLHDETSLQDRLAG